MENNELTKRPTASWLRGLGWLAITLLLSHCGQVTFGPSTAPEKLVKARSGSFASVYSILQSANCTQCHAPDAGSAHTGDGTAIDFTSAATAYATLTGGAHVQGTGAGGDCSGVQIVDSSPAQSYLAFVMFSSDQQFAPNAAHFAKGPNCTPYPVPGHDVNFSTDEEASVVAWINAGAPNN